MGSFSAYTIGAVPPRISYNQGNGDQIKSIQPKSECGLLVCRAIINHALGSFCAARVAP